jgi:hypothetical protein
MDLALAQSQLYASSISGLRPREWNPELVKRALSGGEPTWLSQWFAYSWYADTGGIREAADALEWILEQPLPRVDHAIWKYEAAWFEVFSRGDLEAARERLKVAERCPSDPDTESSAWKARAAIAAAECRFEDAIGAVRQAVDTLKMPLDDGLRKGIREDLDWVLTCASKRQPLTAAPRSRAVSPRDPA